ncbi:MAG: hypothetical protein ACKVHE_20200 [Planctomycetales bacterium]
MAKKKLGRSFADYVDRSAKYCRIGSVVLVPLSLIVAWLTYWIIWATLWIGFRPLFDLSNDAVGYWSYFFLAVILAWPFLRGSEFEETYRFSGESEAGTVSLDFSRATGNGWVLLFDPSVAHGFVKVIALLYLTAPRMLSLALMLHHKVDRLKQMDVPACSRVIGMLMRAQGRVPIEKIADEFPEADLSQIVPPLADVDGVVFLEKEGMGLTLAPRFMEEFNEWADAS